MGKKAKAKKGSPDAPGQVRDAAAAGLGPGALEPSDEVFAPNPFAAVDEEERLDDDGYASDDEAWADGPPLDPSLQLVDLSKLRPRPTPLRLFLMAAVVLAVPYLIISDWEEIAYFLSPNEPIDIGNAMDYIMVRGEDGRMMRRKNLDVAHNSFVRVRGLPVHKAVANPQASRFTLRFTKSNERVLYQLEGARIFVEEPLATTHLKDFGPEALDSADARTSIELVELEGRLLSMAEDDVGVYAGLRHYYASKYGMRFCADLSPAEIERGRAMLGRGGLILKADQDLGFMQMPSGSDATLFAAHAGGQGQWWVGGSEGVLLRSGDGMHWEQVQADLQRSLFGIAMEEDGQVGVVVGRRGLVALTQDGGATFSQPYPFVEQDLRGVLALGEGRFVAVGNEGLVLRASEGGQRWSPAPVMVNPVFRQVLRTATGAHVVVGDGGRILRRREDGGPWVVAASHSTADLYDISQDPSGHLVVVGAEGTVLRSEDDGASWEAADVAFVAGLSFRRSFAAAAFHDDGQRWFAVGRNGVLARSADGARTVELLSHSYRSAVVLEHIRAGRSLPQALSALLPVADLPTLHGVAWAGDALYVVGRKGTFLVSLDHGLTWRKRHLPVTGDPDLYAIAFLDADLGFIGGAGGLLLKTEDGGQVWREVASETKRNIHTLRPVAGDPRLVLFAGDHALWGFWRESDNRCYVRAGSGEGAYRGLALGADFTGRVNALRLVVVGEGGAILGVDEEESRVAPLWTHAPVDLYAMAVADEALPTLPLRPIGHMALAAGSDGAVLRSFNGGLSFRQESTGTAAKLSAVALSKDGTLAAVGGEDGTLLIDEEQSGRWREVALPTQDAVRGLAYVDVGEGQEALWLVAGACLYEGRGDAPVVALYCAEEPLTGLFIHGAKRLLTGATGGLYLSDDAGQLWRRETSGVDGALHAGAWWQDGWWVSGTRGVVLRAGVSPGQWERVATDVAAELRGLGAGVDEEVLWVVGDDGVVLSRRRDAQTWERYPAATAGALRTLIRGADGQLWFAGDGQHIFHSDDGLRWSPRGTFLAGFHGLAMSTPGPGAVILAVGDEGVVAKSVDHGATWHLVETPTKASLYGVGIAPDGQVAAAVGAGGTILRSRSGGDLWTALELDLHVDLYATQVTARADGELLTLVAGKGGVFYAAKERNMRRFDLLPVPSTEDIRALALSRDGSEVLAVGGQRQDPGVVCENGYVLRPNESPRSRWTYALLYGLLALFALFTLAKLLQGLYIMVTPPPEL